MYSVSSFGVCVLIFFSQAGRINSCRLKMPYIWHVNYKERLSSRMKNFNVKDGKNRQNQRVVYYCLLIYRVLTH